MVAGAVWDSVLTESQHDRLAGALGVPVAEARRLVMFWAGLHDLGKILPQFQDMALRDRPDHCAFLHEDVYAHDRDSLTARFRHEYATNAVLPQLLAQLGYPVSGPLAKVLAVQVAQLLGGHHGRYPMCAEAKDVRDPLLKRPELGSGGWTGQRRQHLTALHELLGRPEAPAARAMPVELAVVVAGLVIVSDWLASQEHVVSAQQTAALADGGLSTRQSLTNHAKRASDAAPGLVAGAGLGRASFHPRRLTGLFPEIKALHPLQSSLEARLPEAVAGPGVLLVTAPVAFSLHASPEPDGQARRRFREGLRLFKLLPRIVADVQALLAPDEAGPLVDGQAVDMVNLWDPEAGSVPAGVNYASQADPA